MASGLQITDLVCQVKHDGAKGSNLLRGGVSQASGSSDQEIRIPRAGTLFFLYPALLDLPGAVLVLPTDPILVLQARKLVLVLPALRLHLPVEILLPLGEAHLPGGGRVAQVITQGGDSGVSLVGHLASLDQEGVPDLLVWRPQSLEYAPAVHGRWRRDSRDVQEGGGQVDVEDRLVPDGVGPDAGTSHEEGDVSVEVVGEGLALDQTKLAEMISWDRREVEVWRTSTRGFSHRGPTCRRCRCCPAGPWQRGQSRSSPRPCPLTGASAASWSSRRQ